MPEGAELEVAELEAVELEEAQAEPEELRVRGQEWAWL